MYKEHLELCVKHPEAIKINRDLLLPCICYERRRYMEYELKKEKEYQEWKESMKKRIGRFIIVENKEKNMKQRVKRSIKQEMKNLKRKNNKRRVW